MTETDIQNPQLLILQSAQVWAAGGAAPTLKIEAELKKPSKLSAFSPTAAHDSIWEILSFPERARSLAWLSRIGLLEEIFPVWKGNSYRQIYRLECVPGSMRDQA